MRVTKFKYPLEKTYIKKLDLIAERVAGKGKKDDAVMLFEGAEGDGKTTMAVATAFYLAEKTKREFNEKNVYFDVNKLIERAQNSKQQILIWDEPALQALNTDWASSAVKNITRLLMMARKKRHVIMICMTKFYKFNEYIVVDRAICLVHVYSRRQIEPGRFVYVKRGKLEALWLDYRYRKKRSYWKHGDKITKGSFPDVMNPDYEYNVLEGFDINYYEDMKDEAIKMIGKDTKGDMIDKVEEMRSKLLFNSNLNQKEIANILGVTEAAVSIWKKKYKQKRYDEWIKVNA